MFTFAPLFFQNAFVERHKQCGNSSVGRALASQAGGREFEPRLPLFRKSSSYIKGNCFFCAHIENIMAKPESADILPICFDKNIAASSH